MNSEQRRGWAGVSSQPDVAALTWSQEAELFLHQISLCSWALSCKCFPSLTFLPLHFAFFPLRPHPGIFGGLLVLPSALQHWVWESSGGSSPPLPAIAIAKENRTARLPAPLAFCPFSWQQMKARTHWKEQGWACWLAGVRHPDLSCCPAAWAPSCGVGMELLSSATQPSEREDWEQKCWEAQQRIQDAMSQSQKIIQGLWSPLSFSSQSARPHFLLRERWLPLGLAISQCCFLRSGLWDTTGSHEAKGMEIHSCGGNAELVQTPEQFPKGSLEQGGRSRAAWWVSGWASVGGRSSPAFWHAPKTSRPLAAVRVVSWELLCVLQRQWEQSWMSTDWEYVKAFCDFQSDRVCIQVWCQGMLLINQFSSTKSTKLTHLSWPCPPKCAGSASDLPSRVDVCCGKVEKWGWIILKI